MRQRFGQRPSRRSRLGTTLRTRPTRHPGLNISLWSLLGIIVLIIVLAGALGSPPKHNTAAGVSTGAPNTGTATGISTGAPSSTTTGTAASTAAPIRSSVARRPVRTTAKPTPRDATGGITINAAGAVLPDPARTPGAYNPAVTQADIDQTICVSGWTATVRPPESYTEALKRRQLDSGYAYRGDTNLADYEEDHLVPLELGGSPSSELNLWPEPYTGPDGAHRKDTIENTLRADVCDGTVSLATARAAIARNWWSAYLTYVGSPAPTTHAAPPPTRSTAAPPPTNTAPPGATALCRDGTYSYSAHRRGTCSHHGGVAIWLN